MKQNDSLLRQMFVSATDEVVPPAPWLESRVADAVHRRGSERRGAVGLGVFGGFGPGLRLTAGLVAVVLAVGVVASVLVSTRLLPNPLVPGNRWIVQTPAQSPLPFTPSPAVRAGNWPPGGPVPADMAGAWQPANYNNVLHLGGYTFEFGDEYAQSDSGTICGPGPCQIGNVVVNGSEIDFIQDPCGRGNYGFERFTYKLTGNTLVVTKMLVSGQSNCGLLMAGTYRRVS
jgi:hypothetical protein